MSRARAEHAPFPSPEPEETPTPGMLLSQSLVLERPLGAGGMGAVWRARHLRYEQPVAVKLLAGAGTPAARERLLAEARLTARLEHPHTVKILEHGETEHGTPYFVMELVEGEPLSARLSRAGALPLEDVRRVVSQVAQVLTAAHAQRILHRDLKPSNLMLEAQRDPLVVRVVDFGIAKVLDGDGVSGLTMPGALLGTPAYMAPEQLIEGRAPDASADLWALSVVAYEALLGRHPFAERGRAALCAAMSLGRFERPSALDPKLPPSLDAWFERALSLDVAARFASAAELAESFDAAASGASTTWRSARATRLRLPERLFGREAEVGAVHRSFSLACEGRSRVLLVSGFAGTGKTALLRAVEPTLVAAGATFVSGKFDQFHRERPFDCVLGAFRELLRRTLLESAPTLDEAPAELGGPLLPPAARALFDGVPELERLAGAPAEEGGTPEEARNRFRSALTRLLGRVANRRHPLVLFFDDLQWADLDSLDLLAWLATDPDSKHVLFVGSWRDNEVDPLHPLTATLERVRARSAALDEVHLGPLSEDAALELVNAAFPGSVGRVRLAVLCHEKTHGNAFFLRRLLESLHSAEVLRYDEGQHRWSWDLAAVAAHAVEDDVVAFLTAQLRRLPAPAREALEVAACVGDEFDLVLLAVALGVERTRALEQLREALGSELVLPGSHVPEGARGELDGRLTNRFAHDRVRQAARALCDDAVAARVHRAVGRYLLEQLAGAERERRLLEVVEHLNAGPASELSPFEVAQLRELNHAAARRARSSAAFEPARRYLERALALLDADAWSADYEQTLALHLEGARAALLTGQRDAAPALVDAVLAHARSPLDAANAREVTLQSLASAQRFAETLALGRSMLAELGVSLPEAPSLEEALGSLGDALARLEAHGAERLVRAPLARDPAVLAAQRVHNALMSAAYLTQPTLLPILASNIVRSTLEGGVCRESPYGFAVVALVLSAGRKLEAARTMASLARALLDRLPERALQPKVLHVVTAFVEAFTAPLREAVESHRKVIRVGLDTGDLEYAGWALHNVVCNQVYAGVPLAEAERDFVRNEALLVRHAQLGPLGVTSQFGQLLCNLRGEAADPTRLTGARYDEAAQLAAMRALNYRSAVSVTHAVGAFARYLFGRFEEAYRFAQEGAPWVDGVPGTYHLVWWHQYRALAACAAARPEDAARVLADTEGDLAALREWERQNPVNHAHRVLLLEAERARLRGAREEAAEGFERARLAAGAQGFLHEEALASELAWRLHRAAGEQTRARLALDAACAGYERWGATAKVAQLRDDGR